MWEGPDHILDVEMCEQLRRQEAKEYIASLPEDEREAAALDEERNINEYERRQELMFSGQHPETLDEPEGKGLTTVPSPSAEPKGKGLTTAPSPSAEPEGKRLTTVPSPSAEPIPSPGYSSTDRPFYCPFEGCPRSEAGKGFKRKNELIRHTLVHDSPGYICPFCPDREHKYPRPDNLQR